MLKLVLKISNFIKEPDLVNCKYYCLSALQTIPHMVGTPDVN